MSGRRGKRALLLALCLVAAIMFAGLGTWQLERRIWKLDLVERVEARVTAPAVAVPPRGSWTGLDPNDVEYRHVTARGVFLHDRETLVDALTERGPGYWVITPLRTAEGTLLVNRGFVPPERKSPETRPVPGAGRVVTVSGLLRLSEPDGRFLRPNDPAADRWFSRDVAAIARARDVGNAAPFFIDADAAPNPGGYPIGGLTVVQFRNAHLIYALTWFGLAGLGVAGLVLLLRPAQGRR